MRMLLIPIVLIIAVVFIVYRYVVSTDQIKLPEQMVHSFTVVDEKTFLESMIPHHQEAVDTSSLVNSHTNDVELKNFTKSVVQTQFEEIKQMKEWLKSWYSIEYKTNTEYEPMMSNLVSFKGLEQEKVYVEGMIRHHQGAVDMANKILTLNARAEIKQMAQNVVTTQEVEIRTLKQWLETKYLGVQGESQKAHDVQIH